jgi:hypothetical protein
MESNGTANAVDNAAIWTWVLKNRDTDARFYLAENNNTRTRGVTDFTMTVRTSAGMITIPDMQLRGRQSRWVVTDYSFGNETLLYSSAEVLTYGILDRPVLVFYLKEGQTGNFAFVSTDNITFITHGTQSDFASAYANSSGYASFTYTQVKALQLWNSLTGYWPTSWMFPPHTHSLQYQRHTCRLSLRISMFSC